MKQNISHNNFAKPFFVQQESGKIKFMSAERQLSPDLKVIQYENGVFEFYEAFLETDLNKKNPHGYGLLRLSGYESEELITFCHSLGLFYNGKTYNVT